MPDCPVGQLNFGIWMEQEFRDMAEETSLPSNTPPIDQFTEVLVLESRWYTLGMFLGVPTYVLDEISRNYTSEGVMRCLIELYKRIVDRGNEFSWDQVAKALRKMNNNRLANQIQSNFVKPLLRSSSASLQEETTKLASNPANSSADDDQNLDQHVQPTTSPSTDDNNTGTAIINSPVSGQTSTTERVNIPPEVSEEFEELSENLTVLSTKVKMVLSKSKVTLEDLQYLVRDHCGLEPLVEEQANVDKVFRRLPLSILDFRVLKLLVRTFLPEDKTLQKEITELKISVDQFKSSAKIIYLVELIKGKRSTNDASHKIVKLKVREFWSLFEIGKFERVMGELFQTKYELLSQISVKKGCICISWLIAADAAKLITPEPEDKEFVKIIGVISLQIGDSAIYEIPGEGCEVLEAAMLQAIELKNTRAVEFLLAVGCDPEVATCNGDNTVTNIVNIKGTDKAAGTTKHVCVFDHNQNVEEILDSSSKKGNKEDKMWEKMKQILQHENSLLQKCLGEKGNIIFKTLRIIYSVSLFLYTCIMKCME